MFASHSLSILLLHSHYCPIQRSIQYFLDFDKNVKVSNLLCIEVKPSSMERPNARPYTTVHYKVEILAHNRAESVQMFSDLGILLHPPSRKMFDNTQMPTSAMILQSSYPLASTTMTILYHYYDHQREICYTCHIYSR